MLLCGNHRDQLVLCHGRSKAIAHTALITKVVKLGVKGLIVDPCILSGTDEAYKDELASLSPGRPDSGE